MKKIGIFLLALATIFSFAGCKKKTKKTTAPKTTTSSKTTESINPDDYITEDVPGNLIKNGNFNDGEKEVADSGDELIGNWWVYGIAGNGQINVNKKHQLELSVIEFKQKEMHAIQLAYDGFKLYKGNTYTLEFDAFATEERHIEVRVQLNGGSYENYMIAGGIKEDDTIVKLTTEMQHFKFTFTTDFQDLAPRLAINCGMFKDQGDHMVEKARYELDENNNIVYYPNQMITFDNFVLKCDYDAGIRTDPLKRPMITLNQVGFLPSQHKEVVFRKAVGKDLDTTFTIIEYNEDEDATPVVVYNGTVTPLSERNESSWETVGYADFSDFHTPGTYQIVGNVSGKSYKFTIGYDVYDDMNDDTLMMLYRQRCGEVLGEEGDKFAHAACHQTQATVYGTTEKVDVSGGWHDAGDYGKYVVPGCQTIADLLLTYDLIGDELHYASFVGQDSTIPDILEEAIWELDWLLKMQKTDGTVYHKVTTMEFPENKVSAVKDTEPLYLSPVSYAATADFAAVMAKAAYLLLDEGIATEKANLYKAAAKKAYDALSTMEKKSFKNPNTPEYGQVKTGEYPDSELFDELTWAAIEMYALYGTESYLETFLANYTKTKDLGLGWANVNGFAIETYLKVVDPDSDTTNYNKVLKVLTDEADKLITLSQKDVYNITIESFEWGSNLNIASNGMLLAFAIQYGDLAKFNDYLLVLEQQLNYILGQNACCYCFVTGYGTLSPKNPHHRPSIIANTAMPGMLVGGPDYNFAENGNDAIATNNCEDNAPALAYIDNNNSWSTNEITIYWNSPFTYLLSAVVLYEGTLA